MELDTTQKSKNTKLRIAIDILSILSLIYFILVGPIWAICTLDNAGVKDKIPLVLKLQFADSIPSFFGVIWLIFRYTRKYPITRAPSFMMLCACGVLLLYFTAYFAFNPRSVWR